MRAPFLTAPWAAALRVPSPSQEEAGALSDVAKDVCFSRGTVRAQNMKNSLAHTGECPITSARATHAAIPFCDCECDCHPAVTDVRDRPTRQEKAFTGDLWDEKREGVYVGAVGGLPLFSSADKFDSGTGWPSFSAPFDSDHVVEQPDFSMGIRRTEIVCARSGIHLGHVFPDGPPPSGRRFCVNSASLKFVPKARPPQPAGKRATEWWRGTHWESLDSA